MSYRLYTVPFGSAGNKDPIPDAVQSDGSISMSSGYGPDYERQLGVDPLAKNVSRQTFNQALFDATSSIQAIQAGQVLPFNVDLATAIGGYKKGSIIARIGADGFWVCTVDNNSANPDTGGAGWIPFDPQGANYVVGGGVANAYTAAFTPAITAVKDGMVLRFKAVAANTAASTFAPNGVAAAPILGQANVALQGGEIATNGLVTVQYNSTLASWILLDSSGGSPQVPTATKSQHAISLGQAIGRLLAPQFLTVGGTVTKSAGVTRWRVRLWAGGAQGGGTQALSAQAAAGGGGSAGSNAEAWFDVTSITTALLVIGAGGNSPTTGLAGAAGGLSSLTMGANSLTCPGGIGGSVGLATNSPPQDGGAAGANTAAPTHVGALQFAGTPGSGATSGITLSLASAQPGNGGPSSFGASRSSNTPSGAVGFGAGGAGGRALGTVAATAGSPGASGLCIIEEYVL